MTRDLEVLLGKAVRHFWLTREKQHRRQGATSGHRDTGSRSAVTGGKQLDGFVDLIGELLLDAGLPDHSIHRRVRTTLPGYFRATKDWDLLVVVDEKLLAVVEFKSQVGPSFGNNFNNRAEEAIGSATDLWTAYREGAFRSSPRPWLGYFMLVEDCPGSTSGVATANHHFPPFGEFMNASYQQRYEILCRKLVRERLYDAACLLVSSSESGRRGGYAIPAEDLGFRVFAAGITAHARAFASM